MTTPTEIKGETRPGAVATANGVEPVGAPEVAPSPARLLGLNIATVLTGIADGLPAEITPQSRYQLAAQLTQAVLQTQLAAALVPPGGTS